MRLTPPLSAIVAIVVVVAAAQGCAGDAAPGIDADDAPETEADTWPQPSCPDPTAQVIAAVSGPADKLACEPEALGRTCRYTAPGCEPGAKPDLVCTCRDALGVGASWVCERPLTNCFPLGGVGLRFGTRRTPPHRRVAEPCDDPADAPRDEACTGWGDPARDTCKTHGDCRDDEVCRKTLAEFGSPCACQGAACVEDSGCPGSRVCHCAPPPTAPTSCPCGSHCGHVCLPASCRVDADCGPGALCVGSRGVQYEHAMSLIERYACNDPATSVCVSDEECGDGEVCAFTDATGWGCFRQAICH